MVLTRAAVWSFEAAPFPSHWLHMQQRTWVESNCYVDLWIEVLHALSLDPLACMSFALRSDFEGDQWTFFKPPLGDLLALYGIDVQEMNLWRSLADHCLTQLLRGRLVVTEADAYFLPDTASTTYRTEHSKTSIAIQAIDIDARTLGYFHNAGYHTLAQDDFVGVFHLGRETALSLPPYVEIVKLESVLRLPRAELAERAGALAAAHLGRLPALNPLVRFQQHVDQDLAFLTGQEVHVFHRYAFATLRQLGASCELAALFLRWLAEHGQLDDEVPATQLETISTSARVLMLKIARAATVRKSVDLGPLLEGMAASWDLAMQRLVTRYSAARGSTGAAA